MKNVLNQISICVSLVVFLSGCATLPERKSVIATEDITASGYLHAIRLSVKRAGVHDASTFIITGYPHLRANRFLVGMKDKLQTEEQWQLWIQRLAELGERSLVTEVMNLPSDHLQDLVMKLNVADRDELIAQAKEHHKKLVKLTMTLGVRSLELMDIVEDPGEYTAWYRVAGLYPLWSIPINIGAKAAYDGFREWHDQDWESFTEYGELVTYSHDQERMSKGAVKGIFELVPRDAFGLPILTEEQEKQIAQTFAPVIYQDVVRDYDRIGRVAWQDDEVVIDVTDPVVYYYFTQTIIDNQPVLQINYAHWYQARTGPNSPWIERGPLDGITTRITLNEDGMPLIADFMNTCGCYHFYTPVGQRLTEIETIAKGTDPLVLGEVPSNYPQQAMGLRIKTGWHQVLNIFPSEAARAQRTYRLLPYLELERLPTGDDAYASAFDRKGVMKNSSRIEPIFFFPSGIKKIGYMRQRMNHPTKMIGKEYFADPFVLDKRFRFTP